MVLQNTELHEVQVCQSNATVSDTGKESLCDTVESFPFFLDPLPKDCCSRMEFVYSTVHFNLRPSVVLTNVKKLLMQRNTY